MRITPKKPSPRLDQPHREQGFALVMTIFIIALASILVMNFADETLRYQRATRNYTERIQADFVLKSALNPASKGTSILPNFYKP
jgi:type II secretory pathway component PulK